MPEGTFDDQGRPEVSFRRGRKAFWVSGMLLAVIIIGVLAAVMPDNGDAGSAVRNDTRIVNKVIEDSVTAAGALSVYDTVDEDDSALLLQEVSELLQEAADAAEVRKDTYSRLGVKLAGGAEVLGQWSFTVIELRECVQSSCGEDEQQRLLRAGQDQAQLSGKVVRSVLRFSDYTEADVEAFFETAAEKVSAGDYRLPGKRLPS